MVSEREEEEEEMKGLTKRSEKTRRSPIKEEGRVRAQ